MPLAEIVFKAFKDVLYKPLFTLASEHSAIMDKGSDFLLELKNAGDTPLTVALRTGLVQYKNGVFSGQFSRVISANLRALGAKFDKRSGVYRLRESEVPTGIRSEAAAYEVNAKNIHEAIIRKLNEIQTNLDHEIETMVLNPEEAIKAMEAGFKKTAETLEIMPELSEASKTIMTEEYSENLKLSIKNFTTEQILSLREATEENATQGYRFDRLSHEIHDSFKASAAKAEFLARQETSLFMANYRKQRFSEAGVTRYIWRTSRDARVRDQHKHLEGKVFFYSQPPVVDRASGRRANPGCDFGCRCVDEPVLDPVAVGS